MTRVTILTASGLSLPALDLLDVTCARVEPEVAAVLAAPASDLVVVDAVADVAAGRELCALLHAAGLGPVLAVVSEAGMAGVGPSWRCDDVVLPTAGPAELGARLRRAIGEGPTAHGDQPGVITLGELVIDEEAWSALVRGRAMNLTYKEFELLRHLSAHPGRVFSREQLLDHVWGAGYYGGVRTVDVHVRRLRAKLGDLEGLIETVRGVGYRARAACSPGGGMDA